MEQSGWQAGCPIATVLLETAPQDRAITDAGREAFTEWAAVLTLSMREAGISEKRALELGRFAIATIEGALILSRVEQSGTAILAAGAELAALIERQGNEIS
jgi:TetR/AcrR family transcriptional repressor of lmrAB and yxaGH operons